MEVCAASVEVAHQGQIAVVDTGTAEMTTTVLERDPQSIAMMTFITAPKEIVVVTTDHVAETAALVGIVVDAMTVIVVVVVDVVSVVIAIPVVLHKAANQLSQLMMSATGVPFLCSNLLLVSDLVSLRTSLSRLDPWWMHKS